MACSFWWGKFTVQGSQELCARPLSFGGPCNEPFEKHWPYLKPVHPTKTRACPRCGKVQCECMKKSGNK